MARLIFSPFFVSGDIYVFLDASGYGRTFMLIGCFCAGSGDDLVILGGPVFPCGGFIFGMLNDPLLPPGLLDLFTAGIGMNLAFFPITASSYYQNSSPSSQ